MNPKRKQRLLAVTFIVVGVGAAVGLALFALSQNINLFFNPSQIAAGEAPVDQRIRVGGMVVEGSVNRDPNSLAVTFNLTDYNGVVTVAYTGILPDLFREGQGVVTQGRLDTQGIFQADEVLAKHDENYMPPEIQRAVDKAKQAEATN
ncbi:cytochrome c biogenesis protein CcmE [Hahella sp. CCB-MM4]|uniref:cytochrome c maturation protein CcmE n=1 Tax=Hahella sp. (strain CCB-MM4) TaxID=1926491 RepID=UPI000B9BB7CB|nr:cytochrome c maturation protein CcmE [Hahella sp. CCB-MM4]OZG71045.1 cytochrome c biogenesis protein CcmE [Hahella sp. CCB-MM4]